ncbi:hypothetical protein EJ04DRAFT_97112 [Polyplosphaeria fusca]|uniref:Uncharacterized protein n=1 Tax=Polyplosphaeria fusca TaxID=682080 RepID=A0A9P4UVQ6_9PLEO|nr:hypothetical protein EJ04DRAFT_97112 [Polyplosphaeria fusca]
MGPRTFLQDTSTSDEDLATPVMIQRLSATVLLDWALKISGLVSAIAFGRSLLEELKAMRRGQNAMMQEMVNLRAHLLDIEILGVWDMCQKYQNASTCNDITNVEALRALLAVHPSTPSSSTSSSTATPPPSTASDFSTQTPPPRGKGGGLSFVPDLDPISIDIKDLLTTYPGYQSSSSRWSSCAYRTSTGYSRDAFVPLDAFARPPGSMPLLTYSTLDRSRFEIVLLVFVMLAAFGLSWSSTRRRKLAETVGTQWRVRVAVLLIPLLAWGYLRGSERVFCAVYWRFRFWM